MRMMAVRRDFTDKGKIIEKHAFSVACSRKRSAFNIGRDQRLPPRKLHLQIALIGNVSRFWVARTRRRYR
jgi:hypothetical protein